MRRPLSVCSGWQVGLAVCGLIGLSACGSLPLATPYTKQAVLLDFPDALVSAAPVYTIDDGIDINIPYGSYGIASERGTFSLSWEHDRTPQTYEGDLYCPRDCQLLVDVTSMVPAAQVEIRAANHAHFSVRSEPNKRYRLEFSTTLQPLGLALRVDGQPATTPGTVFASSGQLSSVDSMPFCVVGSTAAASMLTKP